jgi:hypothetical protein
VDLRRGMVDEGMVPQSLQKPLKALEKRGNPWGKMEKKRADWTKDLPDDVTVKDLAKKEAAEALYFVDSITSYDDRMQEIGRATATVLSSAGADIGILGKNGERQRQRDPPIWRRDAVSDHQRDQHRCHPKQRRQAHHHRRPPCLQCPEE